jgi:hypothetical protein
VVQREVVCRSAPHRAEDGLQGPQENCRWAGYKAVKNPLTTDLKLCYVFLAGRVGWRGVEKIRLARIGSASR